MGDDASMLTAPIECALESLTADPQHLYAVVALRRGVLSRHSTISAATLAYCLQLHSLASWDDPPRIYERTANGWRRG